MAMHHFSVDSIEAEEEDCIAERTNRTAEDDTNHTHINGAGGTSTSANSSQSESSPSHRPTFTESVLTPWEKWVVQKAQHEKAYLEKECHKKLKEREYAKTQKKVQQEKLKKSDKAYREWLVNKAERQTASKKREMSALRDRTKQVQERKQVIEAQAKASYEQWCAKKRREKKAKERLLFEEKQKQVMIEQEKRERGAKAYRDWMRVNYSRHVETDWYGRMEEKRTF